MKPIHTRGARAVVLTLALATALTSMPRPASGFCGFYVSGSADQLFNNATEVALMRRGNRTVLTMANHYQGPPEDFAMVVPVPVVLRRQNVRTLPRNVFDHLDQYTAPRLVEYWEQDPCYQPPPEMPMATAGASRAMAVGDSQREERRPAVRIEAQFIAGEYDIVVLSADESTALDTWLHENHYNIPNGAAPLLAPYVRDQWKFFVAKVSIDRVQRDPNGGALLSPLRFFYDSQDFRLPVRLGLLNAPGAQDLIVYVVSPDGRYETANYRNVFIPTNLDVTDTVKTQFGDFYGQLIDATIASAGNRAVVTEYAWDWPSGQSYCDPCTAPPVDASELATLGTDVLGNADDQGPYQPANLTVTRLHTRYNSSTLTEDLVFQRAPGVVGGREYVTDANGGIEHGAQPSGSNNFQARYAIRHPWTGAIRCNNPVRGRWGGPPDGQSSAPQSAQDTANARRDSVNLTAVVHTPTPGVDLRARLPFSATTAPAARGAHVPPPASPAPVQRGCACGVTPGRNAGVLGGLGGLLLVGAAMARRLRRKK